MDDGQLVDDGADRDADRGVDVHDGVDTGARRVGAVEAEVEVDLRGGLEVALDHGPVEVEHHDLVLGDAAQHRAGRGDRHAVAVPLAGVAGGADHEPLLGGAVAGLDDGAAGGDLVHGTSLRDRVAGWSEAAARRPAGAAWRCR